MANSDIRINVSFKGHRKRKRLKAMIGQDATVPQVVVPIMQAIKDLEQ